MKHKITIVFKSPNRQNETFMAEEWKNFGLIVEIVIDKNKSEYFRWDEIEKIIG